MKLERPSLRAKAFGGACLIWHGENEGGPNLSLTHAHAKIPNDDDDDDNRTRTVEFGRGRFI